MTRDGELLVERPVERRLRRALDARADSIDVRRLRPADPPGPHVRRLPVERLRRFALPLAGLAAAAVAGIGYLLLPSDPAPGPVPPATPPSVTAPVPSPKSPESPESPTPRSSGPGKPTADVDTPATPVESSSPTGSVSPSASLSPKPSGAAPPSTGPSAAPGGAVTSSPPPTAGRR